MNCSEHSSVSAVSTCGRCNAGLCNDCANNSYFKIDNKPLCKKCNYDIGCENGAIYQSTLKTKQVVLGIYGAAIIIGVGAFFVIQQKYGSDNFAITGMLLCWGVIGLIASFFDKNQKNARGPVAWLKKTIASTGANIANSRTFLMKLASLVGSLIGIALGFVLFGILSPFIIIAYLIGMLKVKKQIAENNALLSQLGPQHG